jgi:dTDP-4-amino-4,6-dideoxygalactose transaminase
MKIVQAPRASAILYNLLKSQSNSKPWLLPANICPIVPITFFKAGVPFEFVDISAETLHMDLEQAEGRLKRGGYGGLLYAHTYGEPSTPVEFFQSVKPKHPDLLLIDDRCLCIPDLEPSGELFADATLYSTGYAKIVELNLGGYAFLKDDTQHQPRHLPFAPRALEEIEQGYKQAIQNCTPYTYADSDWLQTDGDLPTWYDYRQQIESGLNSSLRQRAALNEIYAARLPTEIQLPPAYQTWRFNLRLKNKERVLEAIFSAGLFASSHYVSLAGVMAPGRCPQTESLANEIINLFNDHYFDPQKAEQVCAIIMENYA